MRLFHSRVFPRPTDTVTGVQASAPSARQRVGVGSPVGRIHGGTIQRTTAGGGSETEVTVSFFRSSGDEPCDFVDSQAVTLGAAGEPGAAQASFAFDPPLEIASVHKAFWWTAQNELSSSEDYTVAFDVEACTYTAGGA